MSGKLNELIRKGKIKEEKYTQKLVGNELKEALYDLKRAIQKIVKFNIPNDSMINYAFRRMEKI